MSDSTRVLDVTQSDELSEGTLPGGGYLVTAPVSKIEVPANRLRELGDTEGLAASIREIGLQSPITITEAGRLVAGWHRLEAVRRLGWEHIPAFIVADDELVNRLIEIDENLKRQDLTVYEQSKHAAERERVLAALGQRRGAGRHSNPATVAGLERNTQQLAKESGMSERTWQNRTKVGRSLGPATTAVLDHADVTEEKHRNLLNSTTQLNHLADIANKRGDEVAAEVAEAALTSEGGNTFKAYEAVKAERGENNHRAIGTGENEWYTPPDVLADVRSLLGEIDLDPASSFVAQERVRALRFFTKEDAALGREWAGRVFLNPPYAQPAIARFAEKMVDEYRAGRVTEAVMLTHNYTDTRWFHIAESEASAICFTRGRIRFVSPDGELAAPTQGQAFFYYGNRPEEFRQVFSGRGFVR